MPIGQILEAMRHDKKMVAGRLHFVLPTAIGATAIVDDVTEKEMTKALDARRLHEISVAPSDFTCSVLKLDLKNFCRQAGVA